MDHVPHDGQDIPVPSLSSRAQWQLAGLAMAVVVAIFWLLPLVWHLIFAAPPAPPPAPDDGTFAVTDRQWATLRFERVQDRTFADGVSSDGKIAVDDDLTTPVFSPFTGRVTQVLAKAGDMVRPGTPLFKVAASEFVQAQSDLVTAEGGMLTARAQWRQAKDAEARSHDLYDHKGAALKDWQQAQTDLASAEAGLHNAEMAVRSAHNRLAILGTDSSSASRAANGEVLVRAPVAGTVTQRLIGVGQNVASVASGGNATQAFTISDFGKVWLVGALREEDAGKAHPGQEAEVRLASGETIRTRLTYVAPAIDPATRRLVVRGEIANRDGHLKPETYATFHLLTGQERHALAVPESAVIYEGDTARVWIAFPGRHRLALRQVKAGAAIDGMVEITGGLKDGDTVVTAGSLFIDRGAKVD